MKKDMPKVPRLRFSEFDGEWPILDLERIADVKGGKRIPKGYSLQEEENGFPYITVSDMVSGSVRLEGIRYVPLEVAGAIKNYRIKTSDIYISVAGTLGLTGTIPKELDNANLTENANKLTNLKCEQKYLIQHLQTDHLDRLIQSVKTSNAQPKLAIYAIKKFPVGVPSLPEQQKIASFLSAVDKKIQQLSRKKELFEQYKKGVMQKIFSQEIRFLSTSSGNEVTVTKGDLPVAEPVEARYPDWQEKRLEEIAFFSKGKGISKEDVTPDGKQECIRYGELYTVYSEIISHIFSKTNIASSALVLGKKNDVVIPSSGETHIDLATASCLMKDGVAFGGDINIIRTKQDGIFLAYYLNNAKKYEIAKLAQGNSVVHLYSTHLKSLKITLPTIPEQQKITAFLTSIDKKIESINTQLTQTQAFKKGLLQQMFV